MHDYHTMPSEYLIISSFATSGFSIMNIWNQNKITELILIDFFKYKKIYKNCLLDKYSSPFFCTSE